MKNGENLSSQITSGLKDSSELSHSGRQNYEKMSRKVMNAQPRATFFRHSAALSLPAVLLRKLPITL